MPFYASNLIFCAELYLKLLLALSGKQVPSSHNLWVIYRNFGTSDAEAIEQGYEAQFSKLELKLSIVGLFEMKGSSAGEDFFEDNRKRREEQTLYGLKTERNESSFLKPVLKTTGDDYLFWRYAAEALNDKRPDKGFEFHYCYLHALCRACDDIAIAKLEQRAG